ncbi:MAG: hypothetical protein QOG67_1152 [Verrucomicrobiota bacterium]|jgi:hypothetical protein
MKTRINHAAVWVLVVVHQLIGFGWYTVFGNLWLNLHAKTMTDIDKPNDPMPYVVAIVASIVVNYALARLLVCLGKETAVGGLKIALLCWFSFLFVEHATISAFSAFGTNPWPLVFLDTGRALLAFAVSGLVLGGWQRKSAS